MATRRGPPPPPLRLLLLAALATRLVDAQELCMTLKKCRRSGNGDCDRTTEACPPCMYSGVDNAYLCYDKAVDTNTCPYTGVVYDCSGIRFGSTGKNTSTATNTTKAPSNGTSTTTATSDDAGKSPIVMYAAIGGGALLVLIILIVICVRRRRRGRNMPKFADSPQVFNTKRGAKNATANTPYTNMPTTSKGPSSSYQRKFSDPVLLESSAVMMGAHNASSDYSGNTATDSLDGMLAMDNTPPPPMLGDPAPRNKRGFSNAMKRLNSGGSVKRKSSTYEMAAPAPTGPNLVDEYLKMKHEFKFDNDSMSDYGSDTMSLDRFSVTSASTIGDMTSGHHLRTLSIAESEYQSDLMRSRTESECFSEMSYNDEKYSFSDDTDSVLGASIVRQPPPKNKEVEI